MKKLILTIALIAGFATQAQYSADNASIEFTVFTSGTATHGLAVGDNITNRCVEVKAASGSNSAISSVVATYVYTIDAAGQRYRGTTLLGDPAPSSVSAFTAGTFNGLYTRNSANKFTDRINLGSN